MDGKAQIAMIDDDEEELEQLKEIFSLAAQDYKLDVDFQSFSPSTNEELEESISFILKSDFSAIIIDQKLGYSSSISLEGTEVTRRVRSEKPLMPVYILTKYIEDQSVIDDQYNIDASLNKMTINDDIGKYVGRIARSTLRYAQFQLEQNTRLRDLIIKSYDSDLTDAERVELADMRADRLISGLVDLEITDSASQNYALIEKLSETNNILDKILERVENDNPKE